MRNQLTVFVVQISIMTMLAACATAGEPPGNGPPGNPDASNPCGNNTIDPGETCDGQNLDGATCDSQGYAGGTLACDPQTCAFDTSQCIATESLRNDDGDCSQYLGCNGNPQKLVECFSNASLTPPFRLTQVTYDINPNLGPADALNLDVYQWNGSGPPGAGIVSIPLQAADMTPGEHTVTLGIAVDLDSAYFCVGITALTPTDVGFALSRSPTVSVPGSSWIQAAPCNLADFATNDSVNFPGNYCVSATISKSP